jgi:hypothetical protein
MSNMFVTLRLSKRISRKVPTTILVGFIFLFKDSFSSSIVARFSKCPRNCRVLIQINCRIPLMEDQHRSEKEYGAK